MSRHSGDTVTLYVLHLIKEQQLLLSSATSETFIGNLRALKHMFYMFSCIVLFSALHVLMRPWMFTIYHVFVACMVFTRVHTSHAWQMYHHVHTCSIMFSFFIVACLFNCVLICCCFSSVQVKFIVRTSIDFQCVLQLYHHGQHMESNPMATNRVMAASQTSQWWHCRQQPIMARQRFTRSRCTGW